jgi:hypothetical protein
VASLESCTALSRRWRCDVAAPDFLNSFPFELCEATVYEIYDPGLARIVATFTNKDEAEAFIEARNRFLQENADANSCRC